MTRTRKTRPTYRSDRQPHSKAKRSPSRRQTTGFRFKWRWLALIILMIPSVSYVSMLDVKVREQFEGKRWALPARVYARPLELYTGMRLMSDTLDEELKALGYEKIETLSEPGQYWRKGNDFLINTRAFKFWDATDPPRIVQVRFQSDKVSSISESKPERQLALLRLEPKLIGKIYPTHNEDRILVRVNEVPNLLVNALVAMEDRNFFSHYGISIRGMLRAFIANLKAGDLVQGGSTLTQQLVKNFYLTDERTVKRKLNEAIMALLLEWHYSKEQILEAYLNEVFLGQDGDRAIHGMGIAAQFYFNRPLEELKLSDLALLVSLVRGASMYNPRKHPQRAIERRNLVLDKMAEQGMITSVDAEIAKNAPLGITEKPFGSVFPYPAFIDLVRSQLRQDYREEDLHSEGLQIFTTLDPYIQKVGENSMVKGLRKLERSHRQTNHLEGAMVVTNSDNGEVLGFVNGKNPHYAGFNRPLNAVRPIGSLVKVAVYLTALERSRTYSLLSPLDDMPYQWVDKYTGEVWKPQNYDFRSHGRIPLYRALANSYNLATVRLGMELGLNKIRETLHRLGVEREFEVYPSMLLGSVSLTPLEVAQMYQTIASGGFRVPLRSIREVLNHEGKPLQRYALSVDQRFDAAPVFLLNYALQHAVREGTGRQVAQTLPSNLILAGKTGTSNDLRDSWFAGFGTELLTVTWVGRDDNKPMGLSGGSGAMVIWGDFIQKIRPQSLAPVTPNSVQWRVIEGTTRIPFIVNHHFNNTVADRSN
ncbi:penicillin-binding protein 1B [Thioploca ingrica]|uniref:Penicillin-binding protein 1B n=1 Tax=Thioploca ingrica TaxID=40754 RepID=A0A090AM15_9GAMM|nr:penicillin-binding protein 1B [Thioploca ingrica]